MPRHSKQQRRSSRGASIVTALLLGSLALTLALTLAGMAFSHLTVSTRLSNINQARSLAEAVISQGIEHVVSTEGEAFSAGDEEQTLSVSFLHADGGTGKLTFDPAVASSEGLPLSTNNLRVNESVKGYRDRLVPPNSIHFVALGSYRGVERKIECIIHFPEYQFALSSKGAISSGGSLVVVGAEKAEDIQPSVAAVLADPDKKKDLLAGHIASNYGDPSDETMRLMPSGTDKTILITGDARATGKISKSGATTIEGAERTGAEKIDLPEIDLAEFDPNNFGAPQGLPNPDPSAPFPAVLTISGEYKLDGMVRHAAGDVVFDKLVLQDEGLPAFPRNCFEEAVRRKTRLSGG